MFDLSGTPTIQKKEAPAQHGVYELTPEPFLRPAFRLAEALPQRRARAHPRIRNIGQQLSVVYFLIIWARSAGY